MKRAFDVCAVLGVLLIISMYGCSTGVESSPEPGIIRVTLKSNEADTLLIILADTIQFSRVDHFDVLVGRGRLYRGENYADLYVAPNMERISASIVNILQRAWLDGRWILPTDTMFNVDAWKSRYVSQTIFEWYVPPGKYDNLQFSITGIEVRVVRPREYKNPMELEAGVSPVMNFPYPIEIKEGQTTEINMEILPFQSIRRYKDSYIFDRKISIVSVQYH
jgi:hypothetical protein